MLVSVKQFVVYVMGAFMDCGCFGRGPVVGPLIGVDEGSQGGEVQRPASPRKKETRIKRLFTVGGIKSRPAPRLRAGRAQAGTAILR